MRIRLPHAPYIANKIAIDLFNTGFVKILKGTDIVSDVAKNLLEVEIKKEEALEERIEEILEQNEEEIEFMQVDRRSMFWMIKKKIANDYDFILSFEERFNQLSHEILDTLLGQDLIHFTISENRVKNSIFGSILSYLKSYEEIEDKVVEKIDNYKRRLVVGSEEYDIVFEKLYQEELKKMGMC